MPSMTLAVRDLKVGPFWQQEDIGNCGEVVSRWRLEVGGRCL